MNGTKLMPLARPMGNLLAIDAGNAAMKTLHTICSVIFFAAVLPAQESQDAPVQLKEKLATCAAI